MDVSFWSEEYNCSVVFASFQERWMFLRGTPRIPERNSRALLSQSVVPVFGFRCGHTPIRPRGRMDRSIRRSYSLYALSAADWSPLAVVDSNSDGVYSSNFSPDSLSSSCQNSNIFLNLHQTEKIAPMISAAFVFSPFVSATSIFENIEWRTVHDFVIFIGSNSLASLSRLGPTFFGNKSSVSSAFSGMILDTSLSDSDADIKMKFGYILPYHLTLFQIRQKNPRLFIGDRIFSFKILSCTRFVHLNERLIKGIYFTDSREKHDY